MTRCEHCNYEFTNWTLRRDCPRCDKPLKRPSEDYTTSQEIASKADDGFDSTGFAIGMMTGVPLSPSRSISTGSLIGAALHSNPAQSSPVPDTTPSYEPPAPSSSHDSGSSWSSDSSSSYDNGSSGGGGSYE